MIEENLVKKAIELSLNCNWDEAIKVNKLILKNNSEDVESMNRIARAYFEIGNSKHAKSVSLKVLKIDPTNIIAIKSLNKYKQIIPKQNRKLNALDFIEDAGKTKFSELLNLGSEKTINCLCSGEEVILVTHNHKVSVTTIDGKYIGKLPDDISARLRILVKNGNHYKVLIKSVMKNKVVVFIKGDVISFPREISESGSEFMTES